MKCKYCGHEMTLVETSIEEIDEAKNSVEMVIPMPVCENCYKQLDEEE